MSRIFRYFKNELHLDSFINLGEMYFNSLAYFLNCEDESRRDEFEDTSAFGPKNGLEINNLTRGKKFVLNSQLYSTIRNPHRIFVYCASIALSDELFEKFEAPKCVCIEDQEEFILRLKKQLKSPLRRIHEKQILAGQVQYYDIENPPETNHALPDKIVMSKTVEFADEQEFRFAFALDGNALDAYNVNYNLGAKPPKEFPSAHRILNLGSLRDICSVHTPTGRKKNASASSR